VKFLKHAAFWLVLLGVWELSYRMLGWRPWIFPAPSHVLEALVVLVTRSTDFALPRALLVSVLRLFVGFTLSVVLGTLLGLAMWRSNALNDLLGGVCLGSQTLPSVYWVPLAVLTFGLSECGILFVLVMGSFFAVAIALRDGLKTIPPVYQKAGRMLGAKGWKLYRYVILPASFPAIASSLRQGFAFAWRSLLGAELIFMLRNEGVGFLLHQGREFGDIAQVICMMIVMVSVGMLFDRWVLAKLESRAHTRFGLGTGT
jgi:NitT/TauT family transport system permease protein